MDNEVDETFMELALEVSKKSPDSNTKVLSILYKLWPLPIIEFKSGINSTSQLFTYFEWHNDNYE